MMAHRTRSAHLLIPFAIIAAALPVMGGFALAQPPAYHVEIIPPLPEHDSMFATGMNERGVIVGYAGAEAFDPLATPVGAGFGRVVVGAKPTDSLNFALGIGRLDLVVGTSSNQPVAWTRGRPQILQPANGLPNGFAWDANTSGIIVGSVYNDLSGREFPVVWLTADAAGRTLPALGGSRHGVAFAINERSQVAGIITNVGGLSFMAVRWDRPGEPPTPIGALRGAMNSEALGLNELGDVAGRSSFPDFTTEAILYIDSTNELIGLGFLAGNYSIARDLNDTRQVVGASNAGPGVVHGFLWQHGVLYDLNDLVESSSEPFEYLSNAVAIDNAGRIAAEAVVMTGGGPATRLARLIPR